MPISAKSILGAAAALILGASVPAMAQNSGPLPPYQAGGVILDLAGSDIPTDTGFKKYTAHFTATDTTSTITFGMRNDPGYFLLDGVSVVDQTNTLTNLIVNGSFGSGNLNGWSYFSLNGATASVIDTSGSAPGFPLTYVQSLTSPAATILDNSGDNFSFGTELSAYAYTTNGIGGYDYLSQSFSTVIGDTYDLSFWLFNTCQLGSDPTVCATYSNPYTQYSAIDPNDTNILGGAPLVYGPDQVPEPASMAIMAAGLIGLGAARRARRRAA